MQLRDAQLETWVILKPLRGSSSTQSRLFGVEMPLHLKSPARTPPSRLSFQPLPTTLQARDGIQKERRQESSPFLKGMKRQAEI